MHGAMLEDGNSTKAWGQAVPNTEGHDLGTWSRMM